MIVRIGLSLEFFLRPRRQKLSSSLLITSPTLDSARPDLLQFTGESCFRCSSWRYVRYFLFCFDCFLIARVAGVELSG